MRYSILNFAHLLIIATAIGALSAGCANKPQQNTLKGYEEMMKRQKKAAMAGQKEETAKKIPEMTAEDYERQGDQHVSQGNLDLAFVQYARSIHLDSAQPRIRYKMGRLFLQKGLYEEARKEFQRVLEANADHALAYDGIGRTWFYAGEYEGAERNFKEALRFNPELWQTHNFLGIIYGRRKEFDKAMNEYKIAIALKPDGSILFNNLGMSLFFKGDHEQAVRAFTDALKLKNADKRIHNNLGLALCKMGRSQEALEAFRKGGDEPPAQYDLGRMCVAEKKDQKPREAIKTSQKAIDADPACYFAAHKGAGRAEAVARALPSE